MDMCFRGRVGRQMTRMILGLCAALFVCSAVCTNLCCSSFQAITSAKGVRATIVSPVLAEVRWAKIVRTTISPVLAKVATDSKVQFVVEVAGKPAEPVTWLVNGVPGGDETYGTIAGGVYHSPAVTPDRNEVHIEARLAEGGRRLFSTVIIGPYDPAYKLVNRWDTEKLTQGQLKEFHGICLDLSGNILIITDPTKGCVCGYTADGKFLGEIGHGKGTGPGYFDGPRDVKVDPKGRIYVAEGNLNNLQRFDPDGKIVMSKSVAEGGKTDLKTPHSIDIAPSGRIYVADLDNKRVAVFDEDCNFLMDWPTPLVGLGKHVAPLGVGVDPNGDVFVSDFSGVCLKYTGTGELLSAFAHQDGGRYHAMCTDRWGNVYLAARNKADTHGYIKKYNDNGALVLTWIVDRDGHLGSPVCLFVDAEGNVYVTDEMGVDIFAPTSSKTLVEMRS